mgnify:CR=1 FL=1
MPLYENFPYTNFHELNLDWLVERVQALEAAFPEGTIGIPKGGTGADNAAQARENLGISADNIPMTEGSTSTLAQEISRLEDNINSLAGDIKYRIFRVVTDLGLTSGTATLSSCWAAMSIGDILIAPPSEFAPGQVPENSGSVVIVRNAGTSGSLRFYGTRTYEQPFSNNYPSGTWHTLLNDTDVIPVSQGGTGAATAAEARQNLGIDFSGTVLSVANVGADTAGNVPLTAADLDVKIKLYTSITDPDIGLPSGSTITAVWNAMPANSRVVFPRSEVSDPPEDSAGVIDICKTGPNSNLGWILYHAQQESVGDYQMYLTSAGVPSGTWVKPSSKIAVETLYNQNPQNIAGNGAADFFLPFSNLQTPGTPIAIGSVQLYATAGSSFLGLYRFYIDRSNQRFEISCRNYNSGSLNYVDGSGNYWSASPNSNNAYNLNFNNNGNVNNNNANNTNGVRPD